VKISADLREAVAHEAITCNALYKSTFTLLYFTNYQMASHTEHCKAMMQTVAKRQSY